MRRLILDCDTGTDDAVAIMLAALHPALDLLGVTTVFGNHPVAETTANTVHTLATIGRSAVPVLAGLDGPFTGGDGTAARDWLLEQEGPLTLVCTGPLSNLAAALAKDPALPERVEEVVVLGGSHAVPNVTPAAERNVFNDPEAAAAVLGAGFGRLVLVTLDATHRACLDLDDAAHLAGLATPAGTLAAELVKQRVRQYAGRPDVHHGQAPVHDPVAVAHLLDPSVLQLRHLYVAVETSGTLTRGRTVIDLLGSTREPPNAWVALEADRIRFLHQLLTTFR